MKERGGGGVTGSWAMIDWNWGGFRMPESRRYSSSVRMVLRERLAPALSAIVGGVGVDGWMGRMRFGYWRKISKEMGRLMVRESMIEW